jgi:hypothetical protein
MRAGSTCRFCDNLRPVAQQPANGVLGCLKLHLDQPLHPQFVIGHGAVAERLGGAHGAQRQCACLYRVLGGQLSSDFASIPVLRRRNVAALF